MLRRRRRKIWEREGKLIIGRSNVGKRGDDWGKKSSPAVWLIEIKTGKKKKKKEKKEENNKENGGASKEGRGKKSGKSGGSSGAQSVEP
jgi:hypothetical protein